MMTSPSQTKDDQLFQFFAGYFHQDWGLDDSMWEGVVNRFVSDEGQITASAIAMKIKKLAAMITDDDVLNEIINSKYGCYFWPGSVEAMRPWLMQVSTLLLSIRLTHHSSGTPNGAP